MLFHLLARQRRRQTAMLHANANPVGIDADFISAVELGATGFRNRYSIPEGISIPAPSARLLQNLKQIRVVVRPGPESRSWQHHLPTRQNRRQPPCRLFAH